MENIKIFAFADEADSNIDGQINLMKKNGLDGLEIRGVDGENISDITTQKAKEVKTKLDQNGLVTWSIGSPIGKIGINDDFDAHLEKLKHTLEIANILEAKNIRIFSFYMPDGQNADDYKSRVVERMSKLLEISKNNAVNLCHENEKGVFGDTPERCLELFKNLPELKGIFDPANFVQCGINTIKAWEVLKPYIYYMHIKDAETAGPIVPAGYGDGNIKYIAKDFVACGGRHFTIEPHLAVFDGLAGLERENEKSIVSKFNYSDNYEAFNTACDAFKNIIINIGE
ncbi:MAG: TIM barrel protein [bacterium]|nr:TIM barrel protein [bacterium]